MYRWTASEVRKQVQRDLDKVVEHARILVRLIDGELSVEEHPRRRLKVIAVVGPGVCSLSGEAFNQALLLEVGMGHTRPYGCGGAGGTKRIRPKMVQRRHKWFSLTEDQYLGVMPLLFQLIQKVTDERMERWRLGSRWWTIPVKKAYWKRQRPRPATYSRGVRFSASFSDRYLVSDLLWQGFNNLSVQQRLRQLATSINKLLSRYQIRNRRRPFTFQNFLELSKVKALNHILSYQTVASFPPSYIVEALNYLPSGSRHYFWDELGQFVARIFSRLAIQEILVPGSRHRRLETTWSQLATSVLPDPTSRLQGLSLRVISGLKGRDTGESLLFDVFHSGKFDGRFDINQEDNDDNPF